MNLGAHLQPFAARIYRMVEGQSYIATRKLVESDAEQQRLEELIDQAKPATVLHNKRGRLHYLLYTPFRYPPLRGGGRFHRRDQQSLFYGSERLETAMAEVAYRRFLFLAHSAAPLQQSTILHTSFQAEIATPRGIRLTEAPFAPQRETISDPCSYAFSQPLGTQMREAGAEAFDFFSARHEGINIGVFSVEAFKSNHPRNSHDWQMFVAPEVVDFTRRKTETNAVVSYSFRRHEFLVKGALPFA